MNTTHRKGFWSGMPVDLKGRAIGWSIYYLIAVAIFTQNAILGIILLAAPGLWYVIRNAFFAEVGSSLDVERKETLSGYVVSYLWNASIFARGIMIALGSVLVLFGLGWISTEDMRLKAAEPTLTEQVTGAAGSAVEATKETTAGWASSAKEKAGGWVASAKGWFRDDEDEAETE